MVFGHGVLFYAEIQDMIINIIEEVRAKLAIDTQNSYIDSY